MLVAQFNTYGTQECGQNNFRNYASQLPLVPMLQRGNDSHAGAWEPGKVLRHKPALFHQLLCLPLCYAKAGLSAIFFVGAEAYYFIITSAMAVRSNKFDQNLCAYMGKLFRPRH